MFVIFIGAPGSGKGTQSSMLKDKFGLNSICVGDILRLRLSLDEDLKKKISSGYLLSSDYINTLVSDEIQKMDLSKVLLLDGYPRTMEQAFFLDDNYKQEKVVLYFDNSECNLIDRLINRISCKKCSHTYNKKYNPPVDGVCTYCGSSDFGSRDDDDISVIRNRLDQYKETTKPLVDHYASMNKLNVLNADRNVDCIFSDICNVLDLT